jgi:hypothetical protein
MTTGKIRDAGCNPEELLLCIPYDNARLPEFYRFAILVGDVNKHIVRIAWWTKDIGAVQDIR